MWHNHFHPDVEACDRGSLILAAQPAQEIPLNSATFLEHRSKPREPPDVVDERTVVVSHG